jgi:hypothetical protein
MRTLRKHIALVCFVLAAPILYLGASAPLIHYSGRNKLSASVVGHLYEPLFRMAQGTRMERLLKAYLAVFDPLGEDENGVFIQHAP